MFWTRSDRNRTKMLQIKILSDMVTEWKVATSIGPARATICRENSEIFHNGITRWSPKLSVVLTRVNKVGKRGSNIFSPGLDQPHHHQYSLGRLPISNKYYKVHAVVRLLLAPGKLPSKRVFKDTEQGLKPQQRLRQSMQREPLQQVTRRLMQSSLLLWGVYMHSTESQNCGQLGLWQW